MTPKYLPVTPPAEPAEVCVNCMKRCKEPKFNLMEHGCWCGESVAPAGPVGDIVPKDESKWEDFVKEHGLPQPFDWTDHCCMYHDLRLHRLAQEAPGLSWNSGDMRIAAINAQLAACFALQAINPFTNQWGREFAQRGAVVFTGLAAWNTGGAGLGVVSSTLGPARFSTVGVDSATTGAVAGL